MGEKSPEIGKLLESFGKDLFVNLGWEMLAQDLSVSCSRSSHKSAKDKSKSKRSHGIDLLQGFYNPFTARNEAVIVECKNRKWDNFTSSNLNEWIEELLNTLECASSSSEVSRYLNDATLTTGILLFNSSDNNYAYDKARDILKKISTPRRKIPVMLYLADTGKLEKWFALGNEISRIKGMYKNHNFSVIYPSIGKSQWDRKDVITPSYLFSDYVFATYTKSEEHENGTDKIDVKVIFFFDDVSQDSMFYMLDMINKLQIESRGERKQEVHVYSFPESDKDREMFRVNFNKIVMNKKGSYQFHFLDNRRLSPVN